MNWFYPIFMIFWLSIFYVWIYDKKSFSSEFSQIAQLLLEKDFVFILNHLNKQDINKEFHKRIKISVFGFFLGCMCMEKFDAISIMICLFLSLMIYKAQYLIIKKQYEKELMNANKYFPYYLNNLSILIQSNSVPIALMKSIDIAPVIFRNDLEILVNDLHSGVKIGSKPYIDFWEKFKRIKDLLRVVKTLYNISMASSQKNKMVISLAKITNEKVLIARKKRFEQLLQTQSLIPWVSFVWVGIVLIASFSAINIGGILS